MINVMIADELIENEQTEVHPAKKKNRNTIRFGRIRTAEFMLYMLCVGP
jgi:hypothetical protein